MFGNKPKDGSRVKDLVEAVRAPSLVSESVTEEFLRYNDKVSGYLASSLAVSTENCYYLSFMRFSKFCSENNVLSLPAEPEVLMTYMVKIAEEANSAKPALTFRSAIRHYSLIHRPDLPSPTDRADVQFLIKSLERKFAVPVEKKQPTTIFILKKLIDKLLNGDQKRFFGFKVSVEDWQIVAKTVLKFHCFARFEEVLGLKRSNFDFFKNGDLEITVPKSKNNQFFDAKKVIIAGVGGIYCPVLILQKYFLVLQPTCKDFYFLPKIVKGQPILDQQSSYSYCLAKWRSALERIGENSSLFGEHSDRIGGLSEAANAGCSQNDLQSQGRWKSAGMPAVYHKKSLLLKRNVSATLSTLLKK